jgi:hypothetical protein
MAVPVHHPACMQTNGGAQPPHHSRCVVVVVGRWFVVDSLSMGEYARTAGARPLAPAPAVSGHRLYVSPPEGPAVIRRRERSQA